MKKDPKIFLEHILQCIERIEEYTEGITKKQFSVVQLQDQSLEELKLWARPLRIYPGT